jgi:hypothetical protein
MWAAPYASSGRWSARGANTVWRSAWTGSQTPLATVPGVGFPSEVAIQVVRRACERPDSLGRSLSPWHCTELGRALIAAGIVAESSTATVRRMLAAPHLNPWRHHIWRYPKPPRAAAFSAIVPTLRALYTQPLRWDEMVLSVDEKTSLPPRPRLSPTLPAPVQMIPNRHE